MWGCSNGIQILAVAGFVWFGWAISAFDNAITAAISLLTATAVSAYLVWAGVRVRRKAAGFRRADLKLCSAEQRQANRRLALGFMWTVAGEWTFCGLAAFFTYHFGHGDLFPPALSLVVSLHFFPLAALFRVPYYHATAVLGSLVSLAGLLAPLTPEFRLILVGAGLGAIMWATAAYAFLNADRLAGSS